MELGIIILIFFHVLNCLYCYYYEKVILPLKFETWCVFLISWSLFIYLQFILFLSLQFILFLSVYCKVEFNQPSCWLYFVPNLLVFQHLVTLYLGGIVVRVVSEIEC